MAGDDWRQGGFGLYIHWPYCTTKCPYCDFNSHVVDRIDQEVWVKAYAAEIARAGAETPGRVLNSIYFGGGTPSLMAPMVVESVIEAARTHWAFANDIEITIEANPGSVERDRFQGYREAGVNRVSLGIQALNDLDLQRLGRMHSKADAMAALEVARATFDRVSFDLIYARQDQSRDNWQRELEEALSYRPEHLSLYQLTIEDGTVFGRRFAAGQLRGLPDEDLAVDMFQDTQELCNTHGLFAYEVSNHAKIGQESRHNQVYWRSGDYVGIGPGAHGRLTLAGGRFATECPKEPLQWLAKVHARTRAELTRERLTASDRSEEFLMMGLRLADGVDLRRFETLNGAPLAKSKVTDLEQAGLVIQSGNQLRTTLAGRMLLNRVLAQLLI